MQNYYLIDLKYDFINFNFEKKNYKNITSKILGVIYVFEKEFSIFI